MAVSCHAADDPQKRQIRCIRHNSWGCQTRKEALQEKGTPASAVTESGVGTARSAPPGHGHYAFSSDLGLIHQAEVTFFSDNKG